MSVVATASRHLRLGVRLLTVDVNAVHYMTTGSRILPIVLPIAFHAVAMMVAHGLVLHRLLVILPRGLLVRRNALLSVLRWVLPGIVVAAIIRVAATALAATATAAAAAAAVFVANPIPTSLWWMVTHVTPTAPHAL